MRWAQLAFVEDHPGNYDPAFRLDYFRRTYANAACFSAGGCVAFYPTKVPFHYRSKWLGNHDSAATSSYAIRPNCEAFCKLATLAAAASSDDRLFYATLNGVATQSIEVAPSRLLSIAPTSSLGQVSPGLSPAFIGDGTSSHGE